MLELTKDFKYIDVGKYYHHFVSSFDRYIESLRAEKQGKINIYVIPMIAPTDFGSIKSSTLLYYLIKSNHSELNGRYNKNGLARFSISLVDTVDYSKIKQTYIEQMILPDSKVCLIDDFIGSGETAVSAANYLVEKHKVVKENISIISIVSMKQGKDELESNNYKSYSDIICDKAISGTGYREERKELMISISEKIEAQENCYLGFN